MARLVSMRPQDDIGMVAQLYARMTERSCQWTCKQLMSIDANLQIRHDTGRRREEQGPCSADGRKRLSRSNGAGVRWPAVQSKQTEEIEPASLRRLMEKAR